MMGSAEEYIIQNPAVVNCYEPLVSSALIDSFRSGDYLRIRTFYLDEYRTVKAIYQNLGNPVTAMRYGVHAHQMVKEVCVSEICIGFFESYMAELTLASGHIDSTIDEYLFYAEKHARTAKCDWQLRIKALSSIYLMKSISEKAKRESDKAYMTLEEVERDPWIMKKDDLLLMTPVFRQRMMMEQTVASHMKLLERASLLKKVNPLEYFRTIKRVFEFCINSGNTVAAEKLIKEVLLAYNGIKTDVPPITKISLLKNMGQANVLFGEKELAISQLQNALRDARYYKLEGQVTQIKNLISAAHEGNVVGKLTTFRV